jgi:hypothetical protein
MATNRSSLGCSAKSMVTSPSRVLRPASCGTRSLSRMVPSSCFTDWALLRGGAAAR